MMKNKKPAIFLIAVLSLFISSVAAKADTNDELKSASQAAQRDFPKFLKSMRSDKYLGIKANDKIELAEPIQVYEILKDVLEKMPAAKDITPALKAWNWIVPVQINGRYRALLHVKADNGVFKAYALESSPGNNFYDSLQKLRKVWSDKGKDAFRLVNCSDPRVYFYVVTKVTEPNLTPLTGGFTIKDRMWFIPPENLASPQPAVETIAELKEFWAKGLRWGPFGGLVQEG